MENSCLGFATLEQRRAAVASRRRCAVADVHRSKGPDGASQQRLKLNVVELNLLCVVIPYDRLAIDETLSQYQHIIDTKDMPFRDARIAVRRIQVWTSA